MRKKRILWLNEASFLHTGFAVYGREILQRLYNTDKYVIAELGAYGHPAPLDHEINGYMREFGPPHMFDIPWRYYGNLPLNIQQEVNDYNSLPTNQFGEWRFERTCLDFKPDIVVDVRDWWMMEFVERSPYRPYFHWSIMPTIDSAPQQEQWLSTYLNADSVFAYSEYGRDVLMQETNNKAKFVNVASPGANLKILQPHPDKNKLKNDFGILSDTNIVGTVMRNQPRKLYPDLLEAFSTFLENNPEVGKKTFLYLHTSYPDSGWDLPMILRRTNLSNKVLFTYKCKSCNYIFPSFFQDARAVCQRCSNPTAHLPNTKDGLSDAEMNIIFNLFDVYVQYSVCEGFGMPQIEAAACGVPIMAVNYSAMESILKNIGGIPINVQRMFWDSGTQCSRALPDNQDFVTKLADFLRKPTTVRQKMGRDHWMKVQKFYNYDRIAKIWEKHFDNIDISEEGRWGLPGRIHQPNMDIPPNLNNEQFIKWCIYHVWGEADKLNSYTAMKMLRDLNYGEAIRGTGDVMFNEASYLASHQKFQKFSHQDAAQNFLRLAEKRNYFEQLRMGQIKEPKPEFLKRVKYDNKDTQ
jgi:glycosyltransferase involved in cell wall biosynthesis